MNNVEKPNTMYHIGVSGGKDSAAALIWLVRESGIAPSKINATFADTGNEHEWTYDHVRLLSEKVFPIQTLKPERAFYELAKDKHRFPSTKTRFCTQFLKIFPLRDHILALHDAGHDVIAVSGTRADESHARSILAEWEPWQSSTLGVMQWRPLLRWTLADVLAIHKRHGIPLNPLYALGAQRVGCFPCIMSRKYEIRMIAQRFPERIAMIREAELDHEKTYGRFSTFFPINMVPKRFRSKAVKIKDGSYLNVPTIDDVVRWAMTGKRARGSWKDEEPMLLDDSTPESRKDNVCNAGFCE